MSTTTGRIDGRAVRELRESQGWSSARLASTVGISPSNLSNIEAGRRFPRPVVILAIARALGVKPAKITTLAGERQEAS